MLLWQNPTGRLLPSELMLECVLCDFALFCLLCWAVQWNLCVCCAVLCCAVLCCAVLCCITLCDRSCVLRAVPCAALECRVLCCVLCMLCARPSAAYYLLCAAVFTAVAEHRTGVPFHPDQVHTSRRPRHVSTPAIQCCSTSARAGKVDSSVSNADGTRLALQCVNPIRLAALS
jgi:hypothetical protein